MSPGWPLFGLRLHHAGLLLRPVTEADLDELARILPADLEQDPSLPGDAVQALHQGYWRALGRWSADDWALSLLVLRDGAPLGVQVLEGTTFPLLRTVDTASWLVASARGQGVGKAMRRAVLGLAFDHLGAQAAISSAWHDNAASLGVSRALGYRPNGEHLHPRGATADRMVHLRLTREQWSGADVQVSGLEACRSQFGV